MFLPPSSASTVNTYYGGSWAWLLRLKTDWIPIFHAMCLPSFQHAQFYSSGVRWSSLKLCVLGIQPLLSASLKLQTISDVFTVPNPFLPIGHFFAMEQPLVFTLPQHRAKQSHWSIHLQYLLQQFSRFSKELPVFAQSSVYLISILLWRSEQFYLLLPRKLHLNKAISFPDAVSSFRFLPRGWSVWSSAHALGPVKRNVLPDASACQWPTPWPCLCCAVSNTKVLGVSKSKQNKINNQCVHKCLK